MILTIPEKLFRQNDAKRAQLLDALRIPALSEALAICMEVPTKEPNFVPGVPLDTTLAHEYCKMVGANRINQSLIRMTHPMGKSQEEMEDKGDEQPFAYLEDQVQPMAAPPQPIVPEGEPPVRVKRTYKKRKK